MVELFKDSDDDFYSDIYIDYVNNNFVDREKNSKSEELNKIAILRNFNFYLGNERVEGFIFLLLKSISFVYLYVQNDCLLL